jgi:FixJ family two-component response regulator
MDCTLEDGAGIDVAKRLRSKGSKAPILFISGYNPSAAQLRAQKIHLSSFLQKPFSQETFCNAVKKSIGSPLA